MNTTDNQSSYGPTGWTVARGVWTILADYMPPQSIRDGQPVSYTVDVRGLGGNDARRLRDALTDSALTDRQDDGPTLGCLLNAAAGDPSVRLAGYGAAPGEPWERVTVNELWIGADDLPDDADEAWRTIACRYDLDADRDPDALCRSSFPWTDDREGWWLIWD